MDMSAFTPPSSRMTAHDPVDDILSHHGLHAPWTILPATGVANRIYATRDVVLRVATDHPEARPDARTESVAAPIARAAGVLTPRLLAFDDSRRLADRPYTIWERIHGETLGLMQPGAPSPSTWIGVVEQLAMLHRGVDACPDPNRWLDEPERERDLRPLLARVASAGHLTRHEADDVEQWMRALEPAIAVTPTPRFLHDDIHAMNVMCTADGTLLAILDWGDAGWGDPTLDFARIPLAAVPAALAVYERAAPGLLGERPEARILWDKLHHALDDLIDDRQAFAALQRSVHAADPLWRAAIGIPGF
jgi:aminoglycoside phosphotransferase (APT) family kinase protein